MAYAFAASISRHNIYYAKNTRFESEKTFMLVFASNRPKQVEDNGSNIDPYLSPQCHGLGNS
jgi:hypothetical protein